MLICWPGSIPCRKRNYTHQTPECHDRYPAARALLRINRAADNIESWCATNMEFVGDFMPVLHKHSKHLDLVLFVPDFKNPRSLQHIFSIKRQLTSSLWASSGPTARPGIAVVRGSRHKFSLFKYI